MPEHRLNISELERAVSYHSRYLERLAEGGDRRARFRQYLAEAGRLFQTLGLEASWLEPFSQGGEGYIYFDLPLGAREFHAQASHLLLDACLNEILATGDSRPWDKWREFGQNLYYQAMEDLYLNTISQCPKLPVAFELAYRKLMNQGAAGWWEGQEARARARRYEVASRFQLELNGLLRHLRQKAGTACSCDLSRLEKFLDPGWELEGDVDRPRAQDFREQLREKGMTPWLFAEMFGLLYGEQIKTQEEVVWETLKSASFSKPEEIVSVLTGRLPCVSEQALREIQKMLARRAGEMEARVQQELSELQKFSARVKRQAQELITQNNEDLARLAEAKLYSENLAHLSAKITESLLQFQRSLTGQLWYLQDLERKERSLQNILERCQYLSRMPPQELQAMLTAKAGDRSTEVLEHIAQYHILEKRIGGGWEEWTKRCGRQLADLIKAAWERATAGRPASPEEAERDRKALAQLIEEGQGKKVYHIERLVAGYRSFITERAEIAITYSRLAGMIRLWPPWLQRTPPLIKQQELFDEVRLLAERERPRGRGYILAAQGPVTLPARAGAVPAAAQTLRRYQKTVTVLIYDIRGSSFMSAKLRQADKERDIKNRLGYLVAQTIRQHGGFPLKDTGDGGVAWFGENTEELYEKCYKEIVTGKGLRLRHSINTGAELSLLPSATAAQQAAVCAVALLRLAEKFIQDNFAHYREWFQEAKEREILVEGMSYAVLPPEFKALFRIGVGLASGDPGREVSIGLNALGDVDLCGSLVNEASLLAGGRDPMQSMVLADQATGYNLIFNSDRFCSSYLYQYWSAKAAGSDAWETKLREAVSLSESVLPDGNFHFPNLSLCLRRAGICRLGQSGPAKDESLDLDPRDRTLLLRDDSRLSEDGQSEVKVIYQIQPMEEE